jgi:hypothetical protein
MYVERLVPVEGPYQDTPIVLIHGQAQTGTVSLKLPGIHWFLTESDTSRISSTSPTVAAVGPRSL